MARIAFATVLLALGGYLLVDAGEPKQLQFPKLPTNPLPKSDVDPKMPLFLSCAKACDDCARICDTCTAHCTKLLAEGKQEHHDTMRLCQDCSTVCSATARVIAKDGPMSDLMCTACADACKRCGDACQKFAADPMMKQCAEECRRCEKACREMSKGGKAPPMP